MAGPATFQQVLAQCAAAEVRLRTSLADAHQREVSELSGRIQELEAQMEAEGSEGCSPRKTLHSIPSLKHGDSVAVISEIQDADQETEKLEALDDETQLLPSPPPVKVQPSSPSAWTAPMLSVVPSGPPAVGKIYDLPVESEDIARKQGTGLTEASPDNDKNFAEAPSLMSLREGTRLSNSSAMSAMSEDFTPEKSEIFDIRKTVDKGLPLGGTARATGGWMHPQAVPQNNMLAALGGRRPSGRDNGVVATPRGSFGVVAPSTRTSFRGSFAAASSNRASVAAAFVPIDPMSAHLDEDGHVQAWPVWHNVMEALEAEAIANPEAAKPKGQAKNKHGFFGKKMTRKLQIQNLKSQVLDLERSSSCLTNVLQALAIHPSSLRRLGWLMLSLSFIMYDVIMIPLSAFDLDIDGFMLAMTWTIAVYWQLNLLVSFFFGYHQKQTIEMRFRKTAWRYATSWLPLDLALVVLDWAILIDNHVNSGGDYTSNEARTARAAKGFYMMRALRVLRLARVARLPSNIRETAFVFTRSEYMSLTLGIIKHMLFILIINHVIACVWFVIGKKSGWVTEYMDRLEQGDTWQMKYLTSLHWSLTQFTPASMSVQPTNLKERAFAVAVLLFALVSFSSFVSSITNLMNHLRTLKSAEAKQFAQLERYFHDNNISFGLSLRVRRYLEHYLIENKRRPQEKDVEMIAKLSEPLRMEIHHEVFSPTLVKHPFFAHYMEFNLQATRKLCHTALSTLRLSTDDVLFNTGEIAKVMHFVNGGKIQYKRPGRINDDVLPGDWICEMVLWRPWEYQGRAHAVTNSSVIALDASMFHQILIDHKSQNRFAEENACNYALTATKILSEKDAKELTDLDDSDVLQARALANEMFGEAGPSVHYGHFNVLHTFLKRGSNRIGGSQRHSVEVVSGSPKGDRGGSVSDYGSEGTRPFGQRLSAPTPTVHTIEIVSPCRPAKK